MTPTRCTRGCGRPSPDAAICTHCWRQLLRDLRDVAAGLLDELAVSYLRRASAGSVAAGGSRSAETALPWDDRATRVEMPVRTALATWAWLVVEERGVLGCYRLDWPADDAAAQARYLGDHNEWLRHHPAAPQAFDELHRAIGAVLHVVDLPAERWYAGPCQAPPAEDTELGCVCACHIGGAFRPPCDTPGGCGTSHRRGVVDVVCGAELYARPRATDVTCRRCRYVWPVNELRSYLLTAAEDRLATAVECSRAVSQLGEQPVTADRIYRWRDRGRLEERGRTDDGHPLYRVGDVLEILRQDEDAEARKARRSA